MTLALLEPATKWFKGAQLGAGSSGKVYLCLDATSSLLMAVRIAELPSEPAEQITNLLSALEQEFKTLTELCHDNIIRYRCMLPTF